MILIYVKYKTLRIGSVFLFLFLYSFYNVFFLSEYIHVPLVYTYVHVEAKLVKE